MSLQLILGNSGSGKTHILYEEIIKQARSHPQKQFLVIVPEQYTMKTQKELVMRHPNGGILNIDVLSFGRLAHRVFGELGTNPGIILDDEGKNLVLRKIAGDYEDDLRIIGKNMKKFGYISEVKSVISEFMQYDIDLEKLALLKAEVGEDTMLAYKLDDIYKVYQGFRAYLQGESAQGPQYITGEELLDILANVVDKSHIVRDCVITFDGFTGFTPVQNRLLGKLMQVAQKVYMTVTIDGRENAFSYHNPYHLFALSKETATNMLAMCREYHVEMEEPIRLGADGVYRFRNNPEMAFLEANLFRYSGKKYIPQKNPESGISTTIEKNPAAISMTALKNPEEESLWLAGEIRHLVRTQGYRYRDIAVITSSVDAYGGYLKKSCELYDIPVFSDQTRSILLNSFVEYIRSLLAMMEENYSYNATFRCIKGGSGGLLSVLSDDAIDHLENYVLEYGIKGQKKWREPWTVRTGRLSEKQLEYLNQKRQKFMDNHEALRGVVKKRSKTVGDICTALYEYFVANHLQMKIERRAQHFQEQGLLALEKEYSQIYGVVLELMDKLVNVLGDEKVSLKEFMELLDAGLQEARIGIIPPTTDEVLIGDLQRTRIDHVKALFFVGVSDAYLPGKMGSGGFLSEQDRDVLSEKSVRLKPGSKEQMYLQKFYLYMNLTKPTEKLYLSYGKAGADGKSARPSYVVGEFRRLFPEMCVVDKHFQLGEEPELTAKVGLDYIIQGLHQEEMQQDDHWKELLAWYQNNPERKADLTKVIDAFYYKRVQENLTEELSEQLYGQLLKNSVSRLEKFAACPYAHFLNYGLKVREREVYEFQASDVGTVLHDALKEFSQMVKDSQKDWNELTQEEQVSWADAAIDLVANDYKHGLFNQSDRDEYMVKRFRRMMHRTVWAVTKQLKAGRFQPEEFEIGFGVYGAAAGDSIQISPTQSMEIGGFIDRIDICDKDHTRLVKVVDYKSSSKDIDLNDLYYGLQLQLFVYLNEALKLEQGKHPEKTVVPAGGFYYHVDDPIVEEKSKKTIEEVVLGELKVSGLVNEVAVKDLDVDFEYTSDVIPVKITKSTGSWDRSSKNIPQKELEQLLTFTKEKITELGRSIGAGDIAIRPYKYQDAAKPMTGCTYCEFKRICEFDQNVAGYEFNQLTTMSKEEVMEKILGDPADVSAKDVEKSAADVSAQDVEKSAVDVSAKEGGE